jgi:hypothetical protein
MQVGLKMQEIFLRGKTLTNHAGYLNYIDNFTNKHRLKKSITNMKSKLDADTFRRLKSLFHLYFIQINFENGEKNGVFWTLLTWSS